MRKQITFNYWSDLLGDINISRLQAPNLSLHFCVFVMFTLKNEEEGNHYKGIEDVERWNISNRMNLIKQRRYLISFVKRAYIIVELFNSLEYIENRARARLG